MNVCCWRSVTITNSHGLSHTANHKTWYNSASNQGSRAVAWLWAAEYSNGFKVTLPPWHSVGGLNFICRRANNGSSPGLAFFRAPSKVHAEPVSLVEGYGDILRGDIYSTQGVCVGWCKLERGAFFCIVLRALYDASPAKFEMQGDTIGTPFVGCGRPG